MEGGMNRRARIAASSLFVGKIFVTPTRRLKVILKSVQCHERFFFDQLTGELNRKSKDHDL